jgi:hypothetical protein
MFEQNHILYSSFHYDSGRWRLITIDRGKEENKNTLAPKYANVESK